MNPVAFVENKNWPYKRERDQLVIEICPLCNDSKWHFYMHAETGLYCCHKCQARGNLFQLQKETGNTILPVKRMVSQQRALQPLDASACTRLTNELFQNEEALSYLVRERGFSEDTIKHFQLGLVKEKSGNWLTIPHFVNEQLLNVKYRSLPPLEKQFKRIPNRPSVLFNQDALEQFSEIFICEGEFDAMSLWQLGFQNVVATTAGAGSFPAEWCEQLETAEQIYLCFDPDEAGQKGAYAAADKLGFERCKNILLPEDQDVNDYLKTNTREDFTKLSLQAKKFSIPNIASIVEVIESLENPDKPRKGILTPWENVNKKTGGFQAGDLIVLSGIPKTGKSTFALNICHHLVKQDVPCLFYCLEMRPERSLAKLVSGELQQEFEIGNLLPAEVRARLKHWPLFFAHSFKRQPRESVINIMRNGCKRYDIQFAVFDNLHCLVRTLQYVTQETALASQEFKLLAEELEIPIMLIAQSRKTDPKQMMTMLDLKDSASIGADADQIIILHRDPIKSDKGDGISRAELETTLEPETLVRIEASRYHPGGDTMLYFEGAQSRFRRIEET